MRETNPAKAWRDKSAPKRILAIRTQAMGDVMITLPYLQHLRRSLPSSVKLDLLTRVETDPIPRNIDLFDRIYSIGGGRRQKLIFVLALLKLPRLLLRRYDVVIDLQNNRYSEIIRRVLRPKAWSVFDKRSPIAAGERTRLTIEAVGLGKCVLDTAFRLKGGDKGLRLLREAGWNGSDELVVLNPAGLNATRNWPIQNYVDFAWRWLERRPATRFLVLGTAFIDKKRERLKEALGESLFDLVGRTTPVEAFEILQRATMVLSEDSGLMHMAWVSGIPTLALFGSS
ncbi:MAG TPA: glycosyltransferase family 9 protein, partial [Puia sp.]|nr:glycosyltransferase family 9 protein [Puia sp.]